MLEGGRPRRPLRPQSLLQDGQATRRRGQRGVQRGGGELARAHVRLLEHAALSPPERPPLTPVPDRRAWAPVADGDADEGDVDADAAEGEGKRREGEREEEEQPG